MFEFLIGSGLAAAAGFNAWMPLFGLGLADRLLPAVALPEAWSWLSSDVALWVTGVLLVIELVADKIPAVDSVNDVIQTVIRPAAGGVVFGAGSSSETNVVTDPSTLFEGNGWIPIATGIAIALGMHALKAAIRPVANVVTGGLAAPVLSTAEDVSAAGLIVAALLAPIVAGIMIVAIVWIAVVMIRRFRRRRAGTAEAAPTPTPASGT